MKVAFRKSFARDLKKIKNRNVLKQVQKAIEEVEAADALAEINQLKKDDRRHQFLSHSDR